MDKLAEHEQSNVKLQQSISLYKKLFEKSILNEIDDKNLLIIAGRRLINRLEFYGHHSESVAYGKQLIEIIPNNLRLRNDLGISYLITNNVNSSKEQFNYVLKQDPNNAVALVHYGFILKQYDKNLNESIDYLKRGINTLNKEVMDGRFFYHLGDALQRINQTNEVNTVLVIDHRLYI